MSSDKAFAKSDIDDVYLYLSRVALSVMMKYKITAINRGPIKM